MKTLSRTLLALVAVAFAACQNCNSSDPTGAPRTLVNVDDRGVALQGGHDPVAFFKENKPVQGEERWSAEHGGATYWFASEANRAAFLIDPERYVPAFGGFCGYAASIDKVSPIDVDYFQVLDGRLVLQHNQKAWDLWTRDVQGNLAKADANWPGLVACHGE